MSHTTRTSVCVCVGHVNCIRMDEKTRTALNAIRSAGSPTIESNRRTLRPGGIVTPKTVTRQMRRKTRSANTHRLRNPQSPVFAGARVRAFSSANFRSSFPHVLCVCARPVDLVDCAELLGAHASVAARACVESSYMRLPTTRVSVWLFNLSVHIVVRNSKTI